MKRKRTTTNPLNSSSFSSSQQIEALHLPDDCWISICTFLIDGGDGDDNDNITCLEPLSLTSKQLLSITNRFQFSLTIYHPTLSFIPSLFRRFSNLASLHITTNFQSHHSTIVSQISEIPFNLKSLKLSNQKKFPAKGLLTLSKNITTLTSFSYSSDRVLQNKHFVFISDCFPLLEELDLQNNSHTKSYNPTDVGVKAMLTSLPKLRKINLSGYYCINDLLLLHLCKNCEFLEDVVMLKCPLLTNNGLAFAIRQRPTLRSFSFNWRSTEPIHGNNSSYFVDSLVSLKNLTCLDLSYTEISDELFSSIGTEDFPLRRLVLQHCKGYTYAGIFSLLSKHQHIQHLNLKGANFLEDDHVIELSSFLADLESINLSKCCELTDSTLFALIRSCPSLCDIKMECTKIGKNIRENFNSLTNSVLNPSLKSLYLAQSSLLNDESIITFASIFPNLQLLDLSNVNCVSKEGMCQILKRCCKIIHLKLVFCSKVNEKLCGINFEVPKLKVLNLSHTNVDDKILFVISKNCCGLLQLVLESCLHVTEKGVKHVIENCMKLKEINLKLCVKLRADIVDSMVDSRPSLRKIIAPYYVSDNKRKIFLHRGCHVI